MIVSQDPVMSGPENMLRDSAILKIAENGIPSARIYEWEGKWVSLGRFQKESDSQSQFPGLPTVKRPTGGKAVLHDNDLTISIAVPLQQLGCGSRDIKTAYRSLILPIVAALNAVAIPAELAENTKFVKSAGKQFDCFKHISPNDVVDPLTGRKVMGCALQMTEKAVLAQCSIIAPQEKKERLRKELEYWVGTLDCVATQ